MRQLAITLVLFTIALGFSISTASAAEEPKPSDSTPTLLGHNIFFALREPTDENKAKLIEACKTRLSQHPGIVFFAVGTRDEKLSGGLNDKNYDVALHMVFTGRDALSKYAKTPDHQKFIAETTSLLKGVRIFDSAVQSVENKSVAAK